MEKNYVNAEEAKKSSNEQDLLGINDMIESELVEEFKKNLLKISKKEGHDIEETVNKILEMADTIEVDEYRGITAATILMKIPIGVQVSLLKQHMQMLAHIAGMNFMKRMGDNREEVLKVLLEMGKNINK